MLKSKKQALIERHLASVKPSQLVTKVVSGKKVPKDNSAYFRLLGGPYHDQTIRMYAPFDEFVLMDESRYQLHGPLTGGEWVYTYNPDGKGTE